MRRAWVCQQTGFQGRLLWNQKWEVSWNKRDVLPIDLLDGLPLCQDRSQEMVWGKWQEITKMEKEWYGLNCVCARVCTYACVPVCVWGCRSRDTDLQGLFVYGGQNPRTLSLSGMRSATDPSDQPVCEITGHFPFTLCIDTNTQMLFHHKFTQCNLYSLFCCWDISFIYYLGFGIYETILSSLLSFQPWFN